MPFNAEFEDSNLAFYSTFDSVEALEEKYMLRCFELAQKGRYLTAPNPRVGCVIVHEGKIIGEGFHEKFGGGHAEVNAIASVHDKTLLDKSTLYVNLEPCSHHGKTPPCADLIIKHKIPRVVISNTDSHGVVNGKGIERLNAAGIEVIKNFLEQEGHFENRRFFTYHQKNRPYVLLKWAQTLDGFISRFPDDPNFKDNWITQAASKQLVHTWRAEESAILVGRNTVQIDNPQLTCREFEGRSPIRLIIDKNLEIDRNFQVYDQSAHTVVYNQKQNGQDKNLNWVKLDFGADILSQIMGDLKKRNVLSVLVEGGAETINSFLDQGLWDEARIFTSQSKFERGVEAPKFDHQPNHRLDSSGDQLDITYQNKAWSTYS